MGKMTMESTPLAHSFALHYSLCSFVPSLTHYRTPELMGKWFLSMIKTRWFLTVSTHWGNFSLPLPLSLFLCFELHTGVALVVSLSFAVSLSLSLSLSLAHAFHSIILHYSSLVILSPYIILFFLFFDVVQQFNRELQPAGLAKALVKPNNASWSKTENKADRRKSRALILSFIIT